MAEDMQGQKATQAEHHKRAAVFSFSPKQMAQAEQAGVIAAHHRAGRTQMKTIPIDDHPPAQLSDRDDGIFIEAKPRGDGVRVYVTIADVAAHVPPESPLAKVAYQNAFSIYRPWGNTPMFPQQVQDRLSLEDRQERLGMMVVIDFDKQYQAVHTEFRRVLSDPHAASWEQASALMLEDPQFQLMVEIAQGIRSHYLGSGPAALPREGKQNLRPNAGPQQMAVTKMVETFMLPANMEAARMLATMGVPFVARNFGTEDGKAHYSTTPMNHKDLARYGLHCPYGHFTSPIRRGVDFYNQHQMHFVIDVIEKTEALLRQADPAIDPEKLHRLLWKNTHGLVTQVADNSVDLQPMTDALRMLWREVSALPPDEAALWQTTVELARMTPPYSKSQLDHYLPEINRKADSEQVAANSVLRSQAAVEAGTKRLQGLDIHSLPHVNPDRFTVLIRDAAITGILPDALLMEAKQRLKGKNPQGYRLNPVEDGVYIMLVAGFPQDAAWRELKKQVARQIKHDPATVNGIIDVARRMPGVLGSGELAVHTTVFPDDALHHQRVMPHMHMAILSYGGEGHAAPLSPPSYSIGHNGRAALSHAYYSFLEHYAFGQLQPLDQVSVPNVRYADLDNGNRPRLKLVQEMAASMGATLAFETATNAQGKHLVGLTALGGKLAAPIYVQAVEKTAEEAQHAVLRKLLRNAGFKQASNALSIAEMQRTINPQMLLEQWTQEGGGSYQVDMHYKPSRRHVPAKFIATVTVDMEVNGTMRHWQGRGFGPNQDRAERIAADNVLTQLEKECAAAPIPEGEAFVPQFGSWVHKVSNQTAVTATSQGKH